MTKHAPTDRAVGGPICGDCYDYETQAMWQWWAPELWRRFTIAAKRGLAHALGVANSRLAEYAVLSFAKVAEYQTRGVIHFHALIRLDGSAKLHGAYAAAPTGWTTDRLAGIITAAARATSYRAPAAFEQPKLLRFGTQLDIKPVHAATRPDSPEQGLTGDHVAGYIAKYATKSANDTIDNAPNNQHYQRIRATLREMTDHHDGLRQGIRNKTATKTEKTTVTAYRLLPKWIHTLGFRGHFSTKSRKYSITLGRLRRARARYHHLKTQAQHTKTHLDTRDLEARLLADDIEHETTLIIGHWKYHTTGWTTGDETALALTAATKAQQYAQWKKQNTP